MQALLRQLPSVSALLERAPELIALEGHDRASSALRDVLDAARADIRAGAPAVPGADELIARAAERLRTEGGVAPAPVVNATGVIIHTNLGRAPLSLAAQDAMLAVARDYCAVEYELAAGSRGRRALAVEALLRELTGAQDALVVNNCAAAVNLTLSALARGRGVVIARGQLVEIGGGFRVPDILAESGARLVEVGTTNKTRRADFEQAIALRGPIAALLAVHASNFSMAGFVEEVGIAELVDVARAASRAAPAGDALLALHDLGSGALVDTSRFGLQREPMVADSVRAGADAVCFSGDKLLGGPQAGIIVGARDALARCRKHPLARAFRADKFTLAALHATLLHYARGEAEREIPILRMMALQPEAIEARARRALEAVGLGPASDGVNIVAAQSTVGGGSLPGETLPSRAIAIRVARPNELAAKLRRAPVPVIARVSDEAVLLDLRTVLDDEVLVAGLRYTLA